MCVCVCMFQKIGWTALIASLHQNHSCIVDCLLQCKDIRINIQDKVFFFLLLLQFFCFLKIIIIIMIEKKNIYGMCVCVRVSCVYLLKYGWSALMWASHLKRLHFVEQLLEYKDVDANLQNHVSLFFFFWGSMFV